MNGLQIFIVALRTMLFRPTVHFSNCISASGHMFQFASHWNGFISEKAVTIDFITEELYNISENALNHTFAEVINI